MENNLEELLRQNLDAVQKQKRQKIKAEFTNSPTDLSIHVAQHASEYREEFLQTQKDLEIALKKNEIQQQQIDFLTSEVSRLSDMEERHREILRGFNGDNLCSLCDHSMNCKSIICRYCIRRVCSCCIDYCDFKEDTKDYKCFERVCIECKKFYQHCPEHCNFLSDTQKKEKNDLYYKIY